MVDRLVYGDKAATQDLANQTILTQDEDHSRTFKQIVEDMPLYGYFGKKIGKLFSSLY